MNIYIVSHIQLDEQLMPGYRIMYVGDSLKTVSDNTTIFSDRDREPNIARKNPSYSELTALQQIAIEASERPNQIFGLVHYRRRFLKKDSILLEIIMTLAKKLGLNKLASTIANKNILDEKTAMRLLQHGSLAIVAKPQKFKLTNADFYAAKHIKQDLDEVRQIILENHPNYLESFDVVMSSHNLSPFNMIISSGNTIKNYSSWLFSILSQLEERIDISNRNTYQMRVFGFIAERLLNVYLEQNRRIRRINLPILLIE